MKSNETFVLFEQQFYRLATTSQLSMGEWREQLLEKISPELQQQVLISQDQYLTYKVLVQHLNTVDQRMRKNRTAHAADVSKAYKNSGPGTAKSTFAKPNTYTKPATSGAFSAGNTTWRAQTPLPVKPSVTFAAKALPALNTNAQKLLANDKANGGCYNCHELGHQARDCSKLPTKIANMEPMEVVDYLQQADMAEKAYQEVEELSDSESEKSGNAFA